MRYNSPITVCRDMMSAFEQVPYDPGLSKGALDIFADNPDPRCPVILLLDKSGSMSGAPLEALNEGIKILRQELLQDPLAVKRVEIAIISFGPITVDAKFVSVDEFEPPILKPEGDTPVGRAINRALDMLAERKGVYRSNGIAYFRPWVFLITDGAPTDDWLQAARRVREEEEAKRIAFFAIGVEGADFDVLRRLSPREPIKLNKLRFAELFRWLSASLAAVSRSQPGTTVALPPPTGWNEV